MTDMILKNGETKTLKKLTPVEQSRQDLTDAKAALRLAIDRQDAAEAAVAGMESALARGDVSVELGGIEAQRRIAADAKTLVTACVQRVARAKQALLTDDPQLAEALAPLLTEQLGVATKALTDRPSEADVPADLPLLVLVQKHEHATDMHDGFLSGRVVAHYLRTDHHKPLEWNRLADALEAAGVVLAACNEDQSYSLGDALVDRLVVEVAVAWPVSLPVLVDGPTNETTLHRFANSLTGHLQNAAGRFSAFAESQPIVMGRSGAGSAPRVTAGASFRSVSLVGDSTSGATRQRVVELELLLSSSIRTLHEIAEVMQRAITAQLGTCAAGLGRITNVAIVESGPSGHSKVAMRVRFTLDSRTA